MPQQVTVLGATGSIGRQALSVMACHPEHYKLFALCAHQSVDAMVDLCAAHQPRYAVMTDVHAGVQLRERLAMLGLPCVVLDASDAFPSIVQEGEVDAVISAMVGAAGLLPTMQAIEAGKRVLLANKESLVMAGHLMMAAVERHQATLIPIDSEHNAIFQALPANYQIGQEIPGVASLVLTASGGPFRTLPLDQLADVTPKQALAHPTWSMGPKISIDSATMMNKGLEVIEAHWLFQMPQDLIEVVIHPQSTIHSMVRYQDGSLLAQLGESDMRIPIAYALACPERHSSGAAALDLLAMPDLQFMPIDWTRYPCLALAYAALRAGPVATIALNAANEVAVTAFLQNQVNFDGISAIVDRVLSSIDRQTPSSVADVVDIDHHARDLAQTALKKANHC